MNSSASAGGLSLIVGGLVGAGLALLYAPRSGRDTCVLLAREARASAQALADFTSLAARTSRRLRAEGARLGSAIRDGIAQEFDLVQGEVETLTAAATDGLRFSGS